MRNPSPEEHASQQVGQRKSRLNRICKKGPGEKTRCLNRAGLRDGAANRTGFLSTARLGRRHLQADQRWGPPSLQDDGLVLFLQLWDSVPGGRNTRGHSILRSVTRRGTPLGVEVEMAVFKNYFCFSHPRSLCLTIGSPISQIAGCQVSAQF